MTTYSEFQPTHKVKVRVRPDFDFSCECKSCHLTARIGTTLQDFNVLLSDDPFLHVEDHAGRRVYTALVSVNVFNVVTWHTVRAEDLEPLIVKNDYSHHNEFASQVRYEDERHYEPDPYDSYETSGGYDHWDEEDEDDA